MKEPMTIEEFELCRVRFGPDVGEWPAGERKTAEAFLKTPEGMRLSHAEGGLDAAFARERSTGNQVEDGAFLDRLLDIPAQHDPASGDVRAGGRRMSGLLDELRGLFSPVGFAAQGAAFALVLAVGVFVGMQQVPEEEASLDLSEDLFASSADFYIEDQ